MRVLVPVALLPAIAFGIKVIPQVVPDRWGKVKTYLERFCDGNSAVLASTTIQVCSSELRKKVLAHYLVTVPECPGFKSGCLSLPGLCATVLLRHSCKLRKTLAPHLAALPIWHLHFSIFTQRQNLLLTLSLTFNTGLKVKRNFSLVSILWELTPWAMDISNMSEVHCIYLSKTSGDQMLQMKWIAAVPVSAVDCKLFRQ